MREDRFVADRTASWTELRGLVQRAQKRGLSSLTPVEVRRFGALYRSATSDLATARSFRFSETTVVHVNRLCAAAHDLVYADGRGDGAARRAATFLASGFPALVRRTWRFHAFAAAVMFLAALASYVAMHGDPDLAERTLGTTFRQRAERAAAAPDDPNVYFPISGSWMPVASFGLMTHNILVAAVGFAAAAIGFVLGLFLLAQNGVMLGGGFAVFHDAGVGRVLATFIAAHGPLELSAIAISWGAGFRLGLALLVPGRRSRGDAFRETGLESAALLFGVAAMLVCAGLLEGFVSPSTAPASAKWAVGAATAAFLAWYFARAGARATHGRTGTDPSRLPA